MILAVCSVLPESDRYSNEDGDKDFDKVLRGGGRKVKHAEPLGDNEQGYSMIFFSGISIRIEKNVNVR